MRNNENKLINEIDILRANFLSVSDKLIKDIKRQDKIMARSDKRQKAEYDILEEQLNEIKSLQDEIVNTQIEIIFTMGAVGESRSKETGNHVKRVAAYSEILALNYGLSEKESEKIKLASPMHDIGKIGIPDSILNKPGKLTKEEFEIMKTHAELGYGMLKNSERELLKAASIVAREHHEKFDGTGYPRGLKGDEIPFEGKIMCVTDIAEALTASDRPYKKAMPLEVVYRILREMAEKGELDKELVEFFISEEVFNKYKAKHETNGG